LEDSKQAIYENLRDLYFEFRLGSKMPRLFTSTFIIGNFGITASAPAELEKSASVAPDLLAFVLLPL
jgi:hypothetical protein